jgi:hypothetical protein
MVLRSSIAGFAALLVSLGAMPLADAAPKAKPASAPEAEAPAEPPATPPAAPAPAGFVPESSTVPAQNDVGLAPATVVRPTAKPSNAPQFGGALRGRWITLPRWFLGMFTRASRGLSSYGVGLEGFRRKRDAEDPNRFTEISLALGFQSMGPPDGNWLGKGKTAGLDTDWVQFKNFGFWTIDFSYIGRQFFNDIVGIHYGAGLGLAIVQGDVLRTSSANCTASNLSSKTCRPLVCGADGVCTEAELKGSENHADGQDDSPGTPHRFREGSIPAVIPLINLVTGVDFRIPTVPGLEFRVEGGFYNALFLGAAVSYLH